MGHVISFKFNVKTSSQTGSTSWCNQQFQLGIWLSGQNWKQGPPFKAKYNLSKFLEYEMHEKIFRWERPLVLAKALGTIMTWVCFFFQQKSSSSLGLNFGCQRGYSHISGAIWVKNVAWKTAARNPVLKWLGSGLRVGYVKFNYSTDTWRFSPEKTPIFHDL